MAGNPLVCVPDAGRCRPENAANAFRDGQPRGAAEQRPRGQRQHGRIIIEPLKLWIRETLGTAGYEQLVWLYYATIGTVLAEPRLRGALLASTAGAVLIIYLFSAPARRSVRGFVEFLLPRRVYLHPSAVLDYKFFVVNQLVMGHLQLGRWVAAAVGLLFVSDTVRSLLALAIGPGPTHAVPTLTATLAFTAATLLAWDFGKWVAHYATHKIPALWEFHKVHHASEVLTPISAFRAHPIDIMIDFIFRLVMTGIVAGVFAHFYPNGITQLTILGFNGIAFVIYYWIAHLQHSHVALGYGRMSRFMVSPVMHQVHHSCEARHWDKNFGFLFGVWDWMFGTLYVPRRDEPFRLGLPEGSAKYRTIRDLYFTPFIGAARLIGRKHEAEPLTHR